MTAAIGPRLSALLMDLGVAHAEIPDPERAESRAVPAVQPSAPLPVVLRVGAVDVNRLTAAGLHLPWVSPPIVTGQVVATQVPGPSWRRPRSRRLRAPAPPPGAAPAPC